MKRRSTTAGALLLSFALALGTSAGPATADETTPGETPVTTTTTPEPVTTTPEPTTTTTTTPEPTTTAEPTTTEPTTEPTGEPADPPAPVDPVEETADLRLTVVFDKPAYTADEEITAHAEVINAGTATAYGGGVSSEGNLSSGYWGDLGGTWALGPGETRKGDVRGYVTDIATGEVQLVVSVTSDTPDANPADNTVTIKADLDVLRGNVTGVVYGDANGNKSVDPGEALGGAAVKASGGRPYADYETTTTDGGRFTFRGLPIGFYSLRVDGAEWSFPYTSLEVDEVDDPDLVIRGGYNLYEVITGKAEFTRSQYAKGDIAHLRVEVTNSAPGPVPDISANCSAYGGELVDLGELEPPGVTLPAGTTRTFDITFRVDDEGVRRGTMTVSCSIQPLYFTVLTRVPGAVAPIVHCQLRRIIRLAPLLGPPQSVPQPGVKVYLRSQVTGKVVVTAVSDGEGYFDFRDVPADLYDFGVVGPFAGPPSFQVEADDNGNRTHVVYVTPGPDQPDVDVEEPRPPALRPGAPPEAGAPARGLASTGADVGWLALGGLLSLLVGAALTRIKRL